MASKPTSSLRHSDGSTLMNRFAARQPQALRLMDGGDLQIPTGPGMDRAGMLARNPGVAQNYTNSPSPGAMPTSAPVAVPVAPTVAAPAPVDQGAAMDRKMLAASAAERNATPGTQPLSAEGTNALMSANLRDGVSMNTGMPQKPSTPSLVAPVAPAAPVSPFAGFSSNQPGFGQSPRAQRAAAAGDAQSAAIGTAMGNAMRSSMPQPLTPGLRDGGEIHAADGFFGNLRKAVMPTDAERAAKQQYQREMAAKQQPAAPPAPAPAPPPATGISGYAGNSALQRRMDAAGLRDGGELHMSAGGEGPKHEFPDGLPGHARGLGGEVEGDPQAGDVKPSFYTGGEFVASRAMLKKEPGLRGYLDNLRTEVLAEKGMTPEQADAKALNGGKGLRAADAYSSIPGQRRREPEGEELIPGESRTAPAADGSQSDWRNTETGRNINNAISALGGIGTGMANAYNAVPKLLGGLPYMPGKATAAGGVTEPAPAPAQPTNQYTHSPGDATGPGQDREAGDEFSNRAIQLRNPGGQVKKVVGADGKTSYSGGNVTGDVSLTDANGQALRGRMRGGVSVVGDAQDAARIKDLGDSMEASRLKQETEGYARQDQQAQAGLAAQARFEAGKRSTFAGFGSGSSLSGGKTTKQRGQDMQLQAQREANSTAMAGHQLSANTSLATTKANNENSLRTTGMNNAVSARGQDITSADGRYGHELTTRANMARLRQEQFQNDRTYAAGRDDANFTQKQAAQKQAVDDIADSLPPIMVDGKPTKDLAGAAQHLDAQNRLVASQIAQAKEHLKLNPDDARMANVLRGLEQRGIAILSPEAKKRTAQSVSARNLVNETATGALNPFGTSAVATNDSVTSLRKRGGEYITQTGDVIPKRYIEKEGATLGFGGRPSLRFNDLIAEGERLDAAKK